MAETHSGSGRKPTQPGPAQRDAPKSKGNPMLKSIFAAITFVLLTPYLAICVICDAVEELLA